jgi:hypothetical protein
VLGDPVPTDTLELIQISAAIDDARLERPPNSTKEQ